MINNKTINTVLIFSGSAIAAFIWFKTQPEKADVIDNTEYFQSKIDSLSYVIESKENEISISDFKIEAYKIKNDSLIEYQNKIYRHYAREKSNIINIPDSSVNSYFARLVNNR
jgi:hypothetical protein